MQVVILLNYKNVYLADHFDATYRLLNKQICIGKERSRDLSMRSVSEKISKEYFS